MLKHSMELRRYLLCGCVATCHGMACCMLCILHSMRHTRHCWWVNSTYIRMHDTTIKKNPFMVLCKLAIIID